MTSQQLNESSIRRDGLWVEVQLYAKCQLCGCGGGGGDMHMTQLDQIEPVKQKLALKGISGMTKKRWQRCLREQKTFGQFRVVDLEEQRSQEGM